VIKEKGSTIVHKEKEILSNWVAYPLIKMAYFFSCFFLHYRTVCTNDWSPLIKPKHDFICTILIFVGRVVASNTARHTTPALCPCYGWFPGGALEAFLQRQNLSRDVGVVHKTSKPLHSCMAVFRQLHWMYLTGERRVILVLLWQIEVHSKGCVAGTRGWWKHIYQNWSCHVDVCCLIIVSLNIRSEASQAP